jgi:hypothetical protein
MAEDVRRCLAGHYGEAHGDPPRHGMRPTTPVPVPSALPGWLQPRRPGRGDRSSSRRAAARARPGRGRRHPVRSQRVDEQGR